MSRYDEVEGPDPAAPYLVPLRNWEASCQNRYRSEGELANAYLDLVKRYSEKCAEADRERRNATLWEKEQRMAERELASLKFAVEAAPFAFVIIDGDGAVFHEDLIARCEEGGGIAAHHLQKQIKEFLLDNHMFSSIDTIFVQVVLSVEGLSRAIVSSGVLPTNDPTALAKFGRGFCRAQPLFSFIDVGYGKEQADHKVRKLFETMEKNIQCRCLILGGLHDNGYATFLESYRGNSKICLLETTPAAADFRKLNFQRLTFPGIFRNEPVPSIRSSYLSSSMQPPPLPPAYSSPIQPVSAPPAPPGFGMTAYGGSTPIAPPQFQQAPSPAPLPVGSPPPASAPSPAPAALATTRAEGNGAPATPVSATSTKSGDAGNTYASVGRAGSLSGTINIASHKKNAAPVRPFYQLNKDSERVDVPLAKAETAAVKSVEDKRQTNGVNFCNRFHLNGSCKNGINCNFYHGDRLNTAELLALKHKTRNLVCSNGHYCYDASCNLGHHCSNPGSCFFGSGCRFSEMHGMDITPTIKIYDDGSSETII